MSRPSSRRRTGSIALLAAACLVIGLIVSGVGRAPASLRAENAAHLVDDEPTTTTATTPGSEDPTSTTVPDSTTTTVPTDPTVQAPPGYGSQLTTLYGDIYSAATVVDVPDQTQQIETPDTFDQQVSGLSQADLSMIYTATSNIPNFDSLTTTFQQADAVGAQDAKILRLKPAPTATRAPGAKAAATTPKAFKSAVAASGPRLVTPGSLTNFTPSQAPEIYPAASCPNGAPGIDYGETAIFALQVATDVISEAVAVIPDGLSTAFGNVTIPNVARIIVAAVQLGVLITHDTFAYLQAVSNDCASTYLANLAGNTDNTAYQTFTELTQVAGTANEIDTNVANLTNQDTNEFGQMLTLSIQQALAAPTTAVPPAAMELPSALGGYLDASPVGVNEVVTAAIKAMQAADQPLSSQATRDETLAQQAFASGRYKTSFDYYRLAYQAAAS
jgi:hypothetical protein